MIRDFLLEKALLWGLCIYGLIVVLAFSTSAVVYAQEPFSPRSLKVQIFADGVASIEYSLDVDTTYTSINVSLFGADFENIIILNHLGEVLEHESIEGGIKIHTLGTYRVLIIYETKDLTSEIGGGVWIFSINSPINLTIMLSRDADIISFNQPPISIETAEDITQATLPLGDLELVYTIIAPEPVPVEIPGVPRNASTHDHSTIIPRDFHGIVPADTPTALIFKNLVLIVDSSEKLDLSLTVGSGVTMKYFLLSLESGEALSLDVTLDTSPPSGVVSLDNDINIYLDIPDASVEATLGLYINETALKAELGKAMDVSRLTWLYWDGSNWILAPSYIDANGYLITTTTHASIWSIAEIAPLQVTAHLSPETVIMGGSVTISGTVKDEAENPVMGATVEADIDDTIIGLSDLGGGNYEGTLETPGFTEGAYNVVITAQKVGYEPSETLQTLTIKAPPAEMPWTLYGGVAAVTIIIIAVVLLKRIKR